MPDSVSTAHNATNATRDLESELEAGQEGKIREIVMDNVDPEPMVCQIAKCIHFLTADVEVHTFFHVSLLLYLKFLGCIQKSKGEVSSEQLIATLKSEKEELGSSLSKEKLQSIQLKQELTEAEARNTDLYKVISRHI